MYPRHARERRHDRRGDGSRTHHRTVACRFPVCRGAGYSRSTRLRRTPGSGTRDPARELMRLLVDMNLTPRWVHFLRNAEHEAIHWSSVGSNSAKDSEICDYARECSYVPGVRKNLRKIQVVDQKRL